MRCKACNRNLNDLEATRKYSDGTYVDICTKCLNASDFHGVILERADLKHLEDDNYYVCKEDYTDD